MVRTTIFAALLAACAAPREVQQRPPAPSEAGLTAQELRAIEDALLTQVKAGGPNHAHALRLRAYARPFAEAAAAEVAVVEASALLHDATKEQPTSDPKGRLCDHAEHGAAFADRTLRQLERPERFVHAVAAAIREHMGPLGFDASQGRERFMTRFCGKTYPRPSTVEAAVLYDIDMLDLMTVDGVAKVVTLRQSNSEFRRESVRASADTGADSAWKSVEEANGTLITDAAKACGAALVAHSRRFLDSVDWSAIEDAEGFTRAVADFKSGQPIPACLPRP